MLDIKTKTMVKSFLNKNHLGVLTTIGKESMPETAAIYYLNNEEYSCYFITRERTRKHCNLKRQPQAVLSIFDESELIFVELSGMVEQVENITEVATILSSLQDIIINRTTEYRVPPVAQIEAGQYIIYKLTPGHIRYTNYDKRHAKDVADGPEIITFDVLNPSGLT